ncbi:AAA family ATPase [Thiohalocapsa sp. ML1]|uniref:AAA family ATPase n=1 Tax=Thiohalocapsa sp. ML1 TaxID=1431688 RepID=UPI0020B1056F|nr:AAA family ATPase [Thiohalocapsa sp. ML1]
MTSVLLKSITLTNFLSYGAEGSTISLRPLNVVIGPNGSGKSNLIEAVELIHGTPRRACGHPRRSGGTRTHDQHPRSPPSRRADRRGRRRRRPQSARLQAIWLGGRRVRHATPHVAPQVSPQVIAPSRQLLVSESDAA